MQISNGVKIIVGLGNPGKKYERTRHNAGFLALDFFAENRELKIENFQNNFESVLCESRAGEKKIILAKPQTFMNASGKAVKKICDFYKADIAKDLLIIHDDTDLPLGTIRATASSSAAGHNGVQEIIDKLGTQDFHRVRIGIESRVSRDDTPTETYVLQPFSDDELKKLYDDAFPKAKLEIENFIGNSKTAP